jgi:mRNA-degrading endonuclease YafQ of YafQ-DinJ toxin-antitoxin module
MSEYSQGICQDGTAIMKDGEMLTIEEILSELRKAEQLQKENEESFRKGFWAGYEDSKCFPDESNILQRYTALIENRNSHDQ